jgi:predicted peroxiredoxin
MDMTIENDQDVEVFVLTSAQTATLVAWAKQESQRQGFPVTVEALVIDIFDRESKRVEAAITARKNNRVAKFMRDAQKRGVAMTLAQAEVELGMAKRVDMSATEPLKS